MSEKEKDLIRAICEEYGWDYPEPEEEGETEDQAFENMLDSYDFTS